MNIQKRVEHFRTCYGDIWISPSIHDTFLFIISELGEISDALLRRHPLREGYFRTHSDASQDVEAEIGDAFIMLCTLASQLNVDVEQAVDKSLEKVRKKVTACEY